MFFLKSVVFTKRAFESVCVGVCLGGEHCSSIRDTVHPLLSKSVAMTAAKRGMRGRGGGGREGERDEGVEEGHGHTGWRGGHGLLITSVCIVNR